MSNVIIYDALTGARTERNYSASELADIASRQPTANELLQQQIDILRAAITDDIRDRASLGDTADLKTIYDRIKALESQKT